MDAVRLDPDRASWLVMSGRVDHAAADAFAHALQERADRITPPHRDGGRLPDPRSLAELISRCRRSTLRRAGVTAVVRLRVVEDGR